MIRDITTLSELKSVSAVGKVMLVFHATWCGPCKIYKRVYERINETISDVTVIRADVDESPELKEHFNIRSVPATVIINGGNTTAKNGIVPYPLLENMLS